MRLDYDIIASAVSGVLLTPGSYASSLTWDSRTVEPGALYVALPGQRVDGHNFCAQALEAGASGLLVTKHPEANLVAAAKQADAAIIQVSDAQGALSQLARVWRAYLKGTVVALTGSSGKTSTKTLIRDVLAAQGSVCATLANQNNELGVPATVLRADADTNAVVVEMGMRGIGQIAELCDFVQPNMALITNVGTSHIELLGSQEEIARAKAEIFLALHDGSTAFLNSSDPYAKDLIRFGGLNNSARSIELFCFDGSGANPESYEEMLRPRVFVTDVVLDAGGHPSFVLHTPYGKANCTLQLQGLHSVHNACAAAAVGSACGMQPSQIVDALACSVPPEGRQQLLESRAGFTVINDAYNANPDSMRAALNMFAALEVPGRRIAALGDMGELGNFSEQGHALVGQVAAHSLIDELVCVGKLAEHIGRAALEEGFDATHLYYCQDATDALALLKTMLHAGDYVLIKASHSMALDALAEGLVFDDD